VANREAKVLGEQRDLKCADSQLLKIIKKNSQIAKNLGMNAVELGIEESQARIQQEQQKTVIGSSDRRAAGETKIPQGVKGF